MWLSTTSVFNNGIIEISLHNFLPRVPVRSGNNEDIVDLYIFMILLKNLHLVLDFGITVIFIIMLFITVVITVRCVG